LQETQQNCVQKRQMDLTFDRKKILLGQRSLNSA
jgi:hypothetical protein